MTGDVLSLNCRCDAGEWERRRSVAGSAGPATACVGRSRIETIWRRTTIMRCRGATSHPTRTRPRACSGTRWEPSHDSRPHRSGCRGGSDANASAVSDRLFATLGAGLRSTFRGEAFCGAFGNRLAANQ
jgi:hypothetical protein